MRPEAIQSTSSLLALRVCSAHTPDAACGVCCVSAERAVGDGERMLDVLQRWGQHRPEVRFFLRHNRAPGREPSKSPSSSSSSGPEQVSMLSVIVGT